MENMWSNCEKSTRPGVGGSAEIRVARKKAITMTNKLFKTKWARKELLTLQA